MSIEGKGVGDLLELTSILEMPANNKILIFTKDYPKIAFIYDITSYFTFRYLIYRDFSQSASSILVFDRSLIASVNLNWKSLYRI